MSYAMTKEEREAFLAGVHVGVLSVAQEGRAPLTVPIWYSYSPGGEVAVITGRTSQKSTLIANAGRFSLCAQDEAPPYRYVTVEGSVVAIELADRERDSRPMRQRYLGVVDDDVSDGESTIDENNVVIRMRPERWLTVDYRKG
jgi:nitroimidazol reductase NimA-like FMN-containing flavoprotein (pyridoxamine 5'-phosphate oxidase superfamily)